MKVKIATARTILTKAGYKTAAKWDAKKCAEHLPKMTEYFEGNEFPDDEYMTKQIKAVLATIAENGTFEVIDAEEPPATEDEAPPPKKAATPAKKAPAPAAEEAPAAPAKGKKAATPAATTTTTEEGGAGKKKTPAAPKPPKEPAMPGVRASRSRPYLAGIVIKKAGRDAGITDAMVAELDEAYGKPNPTESMFTLRNAWHAIRGYVTKNNEGDLTQEGLEAAPAAAAE
jgi:hypothetical protein